MNAPYRTDATFLSDKAASRWSDILVRAFCPSPINIDSVLAELDPFNRYSQGSVVFTCDDTQQAMPLFGPFARPSIAVLLADQDGQISGEKARDLAARYAALAVEKECEVIILSHQHNSGFERFGFRVERVAGADAQTQAVCVAQLREFWDVEIVI